MFFYFCPFVSHFQNAHQNRKLYVDPSKRQKALCLIGISIGSEEFLRNVNRRIYWFCLGKWKHAIVTFRIPSWSYLFELFSLSIRYDKNAKNKNFRPVESTFLKFCILNSELIDIILTWIEKLATHKKQYNWLLSSHVNISHVQQST